MQVVHEESLKKVIPELERSQSRGSSFSSRSLSNLERVSAATSNRSSARTSRVLSESGSVVSAHGLMDLVAGVRETLDQLALSQGGTLGRSVLEAKYAEALLSSPGLKEVVERSNLKGETQILQDVAELFAECDARITGYVPQHDTTTIFRRLGREVACKASFELVQRLVEERPGSMRTEDLDFLDVVEIVGIQISEDKLWLKRAFENLQGLSKPVKLPEVARTLEHLNLHPRAEQLRQIAAELHLVCKKNEDAELTEVDQLLQIAAQCRELEKQRVSNRAGFSHSQVTHFQDVFERVSGNVLGSLDRAGLFKVLKVLRVMSEDPEESRELEDLIRFADANESSSWSFQDSLGCKTTHVWEPASVSSTMDMYFDKTEYAVLLREQSAAEEAGLSRKEVKSLRSLFLSMMDGEDFGYHALTKAVRCIWGTPITMGQNAKLQGLFCEHAKPSKTLWKKNQAAAAERKGRAQALERREPQGIEALQLAFPGFLRIVGRLWHDDLLASRHEETLGSKTSNRRASRRGSFGRRGYEMQSERGKRRTSGIQKLPSLA